MRSIDGRISKLESQFGIVDRSPRFLVILMDAGRELGPAEEAYIETLDAAGLLFTGGVGLVDLGQKDKSWHVSTDASESSKRG
jgi:hypothetical protein